MLEDEVARTRTLAQERQETIQSLNDQVESLENARFEGDAKEYTDQNWSVVRDELERLTKHLRNADAANLKMKAELEVLRKKNEGIEILKEQKRGLENRLVSASEAQGRVSQLEGELAAARMERDQWYLPSN